MTAPATTETAALSIYDLARLGVAVRLRPDGQIGVTGPLTNDLREAIRASKPALVAELRREEATDRLLEGGFDPWEQTDLSPGGDVIELEDCPPVWFPPGAWDRFRTWAAEHAAWAREFETKRKRGRKVRGE